MDGHSPFSQAIQSVEAALTFARDEAALAPEHAEQARQAQEQIDQIKARLAQRSHGIVAQWEELWADVEAEKLRPGSFAWLRRHRKLVMFVGEASRALAAFADFESKYGSFLDAQTWAELRLCLGRFRDIADAERPQAQDKLDRIDRERRQDAESDRAMCEDWSVTDADGLAG